VNYSQALHLSTTILIHISLCLGLSFLPSHSPYLAQLHRRNSLSSFGTVTTSVRVLTLGMAAPLKLDGTTFPAHIAVECEVEPPFAPASAAITSYPTTIGCGSIASARTSPQPSFAELSLVYEPTHISYLRLSLSIPGKDASSATAPPLHQICLYLNSYTLTGGSSAPLPRHATESIKAGQSIQVAPKEWSTTIFLHCLDTADINDDLSQKLDIKLDTLKKWFQARVDTVWLLSIKYTTNSLNFILKLPSWSMSHWCQDFKHINDQRKCGNGTIYVLVQAKNLAKSVISFLSTIPKQFSHPPSNMTTKALSTANEVKPSVYPYNVAK
jgi:hypothetical protein